MSTFTGNVNKLVAAAILQDSFVDKDGTPMSNGAVTCYHDNSRTTLKNWYYQSGTPGNYTYIALPNPLTLSAAGTICDINGVDTIPFFYPWSETNQNVADPYYITIVNFANTNQITRANFPFQGTAGSNPITTTEANLNNAIINTGFWRNIAPNQTTAASYTSFTYNSGNMPVPSGGTIPAIIVAPSQHDGFRMPDIQFQKTNFSGTDVATFTPFPLSISQPILNNIVPEYYVNHVSGAGSAVTQKCYQFPISLHVNTLANVPFTFSIMAQNDPLTGTITGGGNVIKIYILQDTGTGGATVPVGIPLATYTLNNNWTLYTATGIFPSTAGLILGKGGDDALYLQVQLPLNVACGINFTNPSIYLTQNAIIPANNFTTYDQVDAIINSPRTGDIRTSLNSFYYFGWLPMNDGTIGNSSSNGTARANNDTWQLYNLIWNACAPFSASGAGTTNPLAQMYTSTGTPVGYGPNITSPTTAYADFNAGNQLTLTAAMGSVILGTVPLATLLAATPTLIGYKSVVTASSSGGVLFTTSASNLLNLFTGNTVTFTSTTSLVNVAANTIYYIIPVTTTTFHIATSFANALAGTAVSYTGAETGTVTAYLQQTASYEGEYAHTQLLAELATHDHGYTHTITNLLAPNTGATGPVTTTNAVTDPAGSSTPFNVTQPGTFYNMFIKL
ncbi:MAG TPA: hypothetical protein VGJ00_10350 [Rhabdochlamydiaceae bacterium]|jgi:hypothetical protein